MDKTPKTTPRKNWNPSKHGILEPTSTTRLERSQRHRRTSHIHTNPKTRDKQRLKTRQSIKLDYYSLASSSYFYYKKLHLFNLDFIYKENEKREDNGAKPSISLQE